MKKILILGLSLLIMMSLLACNDKKSTNNIANAINSIETELPSEDNMVEPENNSTTSETETSAPIEEEVEPEVVDEPEEEPVEEIDPEGKFFSKLTGLELTEEQSKIRPVVVMLDNHYLARPQAGLSEADVVYEILAEGKITRYMAVFQSQEPELVGPVRSARPYYIEKALEFEPLYMHVGGSPQALADIKSYNMGDLDGLNIGGDKFFRLQHKITKETYEHSMYASIPKLRELAENRGYYTEVDFVGLPIHYQYKAIEGETAENVTIIYKAANSSDSVGYYIGYEYDEDSQSYLRYVNGQAHLDEESLIHLSADNIIIQENVHVVLDDKLRKDIDVIGSGKGYYFNKGEYINITWKKNSAREQTKFYRMDGSELLLNPGVTWVQVVPKGEVPQID